MNDGSAKAELKQWAGLVMLDRDGTINVNYGYVTKPSNVDLIAGSAAAIGRLKRAGFFTAVVTNQSAIGRGMATDDDVAATNREIQRRLLLEDADAVLDLIVYCGSHPDAGDDRRKPGAGMMRDVSEKVAVDSGRTWMVGDSARDLQFGVNAGLSKNRCILVASGDGEQTWSALSDDERREFRYVKDLAAAAAIILDTQPGGVSR